MSNRTKSCSGRPCVALYTFGQFLHPAKDAANDGFYAREPLNFRAVEKSKGFISRSGYTDEPGPESWGEQVYPRFFSDNGDGFAPSTLSLWENLEAIRAFTYYGIHAEALKHGREWFRKPLWPPYVMWWVHDSAQPTWSESAEKLEQIHDRGATASAFDFKTPFGADGNRAFLDQNLIESLVLENASET